MWVRPARIDIAHNLVATSPLFALPKEAVAVLEALHATLSSKFPVPLTDLISTGGPRFSDISVKVVLAGGNANIEVTPEQIGCHFQWLRTDEDVNLFVDVTQLVETAVQSVFRSLQFKSRRVVIAYWLECENGRDGAVSAMNKVVGTSGLPKTLGHAEVVIPHLTIQANNDAEGFRARFDIEESTLPSTHLFLKLECEFLAAGKFYTVDPARAKVSEIVTDMLTALGGRVAVATDKNDK